jgi:hypothetical protein
MINKDGCHESRFPEELERLARKWCLNKEDEDEFFVDLIDFEEMIENDE